MKIFSFKPLAVHDRIGGTSSDLFKTVVLTEAVRSAPQRSPAKPVSVPPTPSSPPGYEKISSVLAPVIVISAIGLVAAIVASSAKPS